MLDDDYVTRVLIKVVECFCLNILLYVEGDQYNDVYLKNSD